jgi:chromosome segregation ATPase
MDEKILEFWGNLFLNMAQGKHQMDNLSAWMKDGFEELSAMYEKMNDLYKLSDQGEEYKKTAQKLTREFQNSLKDYLSMMGIVSKDEFLTLVEKYEKLKQKCADQEETIRHLRMLLNAKETDQNNVMDEMQDIARNQSEFFKKMMGDFGKFLNSTTPANDDCDGKDEKGEGSDDTPAPPRSMGKKSPE